MLADDEVFEVARSRLIASALEVPSRAVVSAAVSTADAVVFRPFFWLVLDVERMNSLSGFLEQIRIEWENAFEDFLWSVLLVAEDHREALARVVDENRVAEENLVFGRDVVEDCRDGW